MYPRTLSSAGGTNVWSIAGAPKRGAMRSLFIYVCEYKVMATNMNKQRASGRKDGYACISGLVDICERPHMSTEQRKAARAAEAGRSTNVWSIAGAPKRGAMRSLFIYVCEYKVMATNMIIRFAWKQLKRHRKGKLNEHYSISGSARGK